MQSVLIVEDSYVLQRLLQVALAPLGLDVHTAGTITEAKLTVEVVKPDVVILDIGLPDGNGNDLLTWIRGEEKFENVNVVMASGLANQSDIDWAINAGASAFLVKPYSPDEIRSAVMTIITGSDTETDSDADADSLAV